VIRILTGLAVAAAFLGVTAISSGDGNTAIAAQFTIEGVATGAEEVPPVTGPGTARVRFVFDDVAKTLQFSATVNGISQDQVTAAHIHRAARGVNGPIIHTLSATGFTTVSGTLNLSDADIADLRAGNLYFNAHSVTNPGGFARLQLALPAAAQPTAAPTTGTGVTPPSTGDAGLIGEGQSGWLPFAALALIAIAGTGAALAVRTRR
jgi:hypothetical protein